MQTGTVKSAPHFDAGMQKDNGAADDSSAACYRGKRTGRHRPELGPAYSDLSMFQNTGVAGPSITPEIDFRHALGP